MILAVDVHYTDNRARTAGVLFEHWQDAAPHSEYVSLLEGVAAYEPGQFFKRELPCILKLIEENALQPDRIIVDGYVYVDGHSKPGLGKRLYDTVTRPVSVIGIAKKAFQGIDERYAVYRGRSTNPLYVTAVGMETEQAKDYVRAMHGPYRLPTLIKRVDQLCRGLHT